MDYDLEELLKTCEQEKLHLSGMIQEFAALLVFEEENFIITNVSENIDKFVKFKYEELLGKNIKDVFPRWLEELKQIKTKSKTPYIYVKIREDELYLKISKTDKNYVIDIQKNSHLNLNEINKNSHELYIAPDSQESYKKYIKTYMRIVSKILNFDRIMLYEFQEDWSGKVISEKTSSSSYGSYLNLRFPASDIPKIARDLYMLNPSRIIADTNSKNINILSLTKKIPDLTYSDIRSVSPVHIQYLKNMGVVSSFSIPIIISDELWGLLACHNFSKKVLKPYEVYLAVEKTKLFSLGLKNFLAKEKLNYLDIIDHKIDDIIDRFEDIKSIKEAINNNQEELLDLINADGFVLITKNEIFAFGNLPDNESFMKIDKQVLEHQKNSLICSSISNELITQGNYLGPSGVFAVKSDYNSSIDRCFWFRSEFIEELHWAGNPNKPVVEDAGALKLSPRRSFEKYIEVKRAYSKSFSKLEITSTLRFSNKLFKYLNKEL